MALGGLGQRTRSPLSIALVHPRDEHELDEDEGEHHQQECRTREKNNDREDPAGVGLEGDVAEAERRHRREGPVDARRPGKGAALAGHELVEECAEHSHHRHEHDREHEDGLAPTPLLGPTSQRLGEIEISAGRWRGARAHPLRHLSHRRPERLQHERPHNSVIRSMVAHPTLSGIARIKETLVPFLLAIY